MPLIDLTFPQGALGAEQRAQLAEHLTAALLRAERAPDTEFFRRITWCYMHELPADAVYLLTGYRADADLLCRAGVALNDREAPVHDPETFETNVPGLFVAGGAIAGVDTGTIFIENGRFHGEKIVEVIARRG